MKTSTCCPSCPRPRCNEFLREVRVRLSVPRSSSAAITMPIWQTSELEPNRPGKPGSPQRVSSRGNPHAQPPCRAGTTLSLDGYRMGSSNSSDIVATRPKSVASSRRSATATTRAAARPSSSAVHTIHHTRAPQALDGTYTVQYIGVARGELGILTQKQVRPCGPDALRGRRRDVKDRARCARLRPLPVCRDQTQGVPAVCGLYKKVAGMLTAECAYGRQAGLSMQLGAARVVAFGGRSMRQCRLGYAKKCRLGCIRRVYTPGPAPSSRVIGSRHRVKANADARCLAVPVAVLCTVSATWRCFALR